MLWAAFMTTLATAAWTHGVFSPEYTRQISHRWRPLVHPTDSEPEEPSAFFDGDKIERYTRAMVSLQFVRQGRRPFGILSNHEHRMCLFVMHTLPARKHSIQSVLWWEVADEEFCRLSAEQLWLWHQDHFPGIDLVVSAQMKATDRALIKEAWGV